MGLPNVNVNILLEEMICGSCGILFAMPCWYLNQKRKDHSSWHCPNGHSRYFPDQSGEERLRVENDRLQKKLEWKRAEAERLNNQLRGTRGVVTKIKRRIELGVCIYCKRHFNKLQKHMESKHKEECK